jgi:Trm5-related predicted tRNA methylase
MEEAHVFHCLLQVCREHTASGRTDDTEVQLGFSTSSKEEAMARNASIQVVVDLGFGGEMSTDEKKVLIKQLRCSVNSYAKHRQKQASSPVRLSLVGFDQRLARLAASMSVDVSTWPARAEPLEKFLDAQGNMLKRRLIYLTPDAAEPMLDLLPGDVIVIGGMVDSPTRPGNFLTQIWFKHF